MSTSNDTTKSAQPSLVKDTVTSARHYLRNAANWVRPYLRGRRGLMLLAVVVLAAGAALNWGWLVAIGIAPILVALVPCAAMCALGLCMNKMGGKSCSSSERSPETNPSKAVSNIPPKETLPTRMVALETARQAEDH